MHIGLICGIGPAATVAYYNGLISAFRQSGQALKLTMVHADASVLIANASTGQDVAQAYIFAQHLDQLKGAGCDIAGITALTGHFCMDALQPISPLPILNAIQAVDEFCVASGIGTIGLLGSPPVMASHLFGQLKQTQTVIPDSDIHVLGQAYLDVATSGECPAPTRQMFFDAGKQMIAHQNAQAILLAGTDLGLAFDGQSPGYPVIDALEIHVAALLERATRHHEKSVM